MSRSAQDDSFEDKGQCVRRLIHDKPLHEGFAKVYLTYLRTCPLFFTGIGKTFWANLSHLPHPLELFRGLSKPLSSVHGPFLWFV